MVYSQISQQKSLRSLVTSFNQQYVHHYRLGTGNVVRSTVSYANNHREVGIFEAMAKHLMQVAGKSNGRCQGIKLHMEYDANGQYPTFFAITPANVNDIAIKDKLTIIPQAT